MPEIIWCEVEGCREHEHVGNGIEEMASSITMAGTATLHTLYCPDEKTWTRLCAAHLAEAKSARLGPGQQLEDKEIKNV